VTLLQSILRDLGLQRRQKPALSLARAHRSRVHPRRPGSARRPEPAAVPSEAAPDPSRVRQGFLTRQGVDTICQHLPTELADAVRFLFFPTWRVGEVRTVQRRDYDRTDRVSRLGRSTRRNRTPRLLPVEGEIATIMDRRLKARRLDCHTSSTGTAVASATSGSAGRRRVRRPASPGGSSTTSDARG